MFGGDRFGLDVAAQTRPVCQGSAVRFGDASSSSADAQKKIGRGRWADSIVGDSSPRHPDPVPAHFNPPHILPSLLLDKDARCDATGHSAKTSKDPTDSLDVGRILVNAKRSDSSNCAQAPCALPRPIHKGQTRSMVLVVGISMKWLKLRIGSINRSAGATDSSSGWFRKMPDAQRRRRLQQWAG